METTVGIFQSLLTAEQAANKLKESGLDWDRINLLTPGDEERIAREVPTIDAEQTGTGKPLGGVVGAASGAGLGAAATNLLIPGVGLVFSLGMVAGAVVGALVGASAGEKLDQSLSEGLPKDELFVYEDALRQGRTILIAITDDVSRSDLVRKILTQAGAESVDVAREKWWIGLRDAESEEYEAGGGSFLRDEAQFRRGFEAALRSEVRGLSYDEATEFLSTHHVGFYRREAFRQGFERGREYYKSHRRELSHKQTSK